MGRRQFTRSTAAAAATRSSPRDLSSATASLTVDAAGEVVLSDGSGDTDTLRRFTTIVLSDATVTISGNTLTEAFTNGDEGRQDLHARRTLQHHRLQCEQPGNRAVLHHANPRRFHWQDRSDILFVSETSNPSTSNALATWQLNDATITGGGTIGNPGPAMDLPGRRAISMATATATFCGATRTASWRSGR